MEIYKPDKILFDEPLITPLRRNLSDESAFKRFIHWRTGRRHFQVKEDWIVWVEYLQLWIKIPAGFVFDGASVPKFLHSIINSIDALFYGSIIHDFIYRTNQLIVCTDDDFGMWVLIDDVTKRRADKVMYEFSKQAEGIIIPNAIAYAVLTPGGQLTWYKARRMDMRLLTPYPTETNSVLNYYN